MTDPSRQKVAEALEGVLDELGKLTTQVDRLRQRGRWWIGGLVLFVAAILIAGTLGRVDARHQDRENNQRWCSLLNTITAPLPPGQATTPTTERQRTTLAKLNELRDQFGCR